MTIEEHTRRRFLAALGASGAAAALVPGAVSAEQFRGDAVFASDQYGPADVASVAGDRIEAFPPPTAGLKYSFINAGHLLPFVNGPVYTRSPWIAAVGGTFGCSLNMLPDGAVIREVSCAFLKSTPTYLGNVTVYLFKIPATPPSGSTSVFLGAGSSTSLAPAAPVQYINFAATGTDAERTINSAESEHWFFVEIGSNTVFEFRVGWVPPAAPLGFYPLAPKRVYDSRRPTGGGLLAAGGTRVVSVKDGYVNDTDTLDAPNIVPVGAKAIAYNITIVGTTGAGYLSVGPGDATSAAGSAINWGGPDQVLANGLTVTLDASRQIKVFAGPGGGTQFLIDVNGYYA